MLNLIEIGFYPSQFGIIVSDQLNVLAQQPPQQFLGVTQHHIQVQDSRRQYLPPAEGQQLLGKRCSTFRRLPDFFHSAAFAVGKLSFLQQELTASFNDRQQVIEVMRHTTGKSSNGLHLLRLP